VVKEATMDLAVLSERLVAFCRARYGDPDVAVSDVVTMPGHAGFAYGFAVTHRGGTDRWFLRLPPPNVRWEGTADMLRQVTALQALDGSEVPHCRVQWYGGPDDLTWFGCPYFVVEQLRGGDVIGMGGGSTWVSALSAAQRVEMGRQAMVALVGIHRTDWPARCGYLGEPVSLERDVTRWDRFVERAADPAALGDVARLRQLLLDQRPHEAHVGLFHGDFQFSNLYYTTAGELRAVLDWELCGIGATLNDVGWVATFNDPAAWQHEGAVPAGMPRADELIAQYRDAWGEPPADIAWFRALAAYKFAIITGFNLGLHRRGKRPDPLWELIGESIGSLQTRALELLEA
jgi:aminoglycoside phosphotransferase (APT) family kinase protein